MNRRIRELQSQAFIECKRYNDDCGDNLVKTDEVFAKFAELIVKECANICHDRKLTPSVFTGDELLEHFGVEE